MPKPTSLPPPVAAFFAASNAHDAAAAALSFAEDAVVRDEGREWRGRADIRAWMQAAIEKYNLSVEVTDIEEKAGKSIVTGRVSGTFPGSPLDLRHQFTIADGKIVRLEIGS